MNFKQFYLNEMAKPKDDHKVLWYHGTNEKSVNEIKKDGYLIPRKDVTEKTKSYMAPMFNKVYMTKDIEEAIKYGLFRSRIYLGRENKENFGYLVIVDGNDFEDIDPDEDIIADLIPKYIDKEKNLWLRNLAMAKAPKLLDKYDKSGDYQYGTKLGKTLIKYLSDEQKYKLIEQGNKIAHTGKIQVKEIWKINSKKLQIELEQAILGEKDVYKNYKTFSHLVWSRK